MLYEFEDVATGRVVELAMPMRDAVGIGTVIEHEGRKLRRIPSMVAAAVAPDLHFTSHQLPKRWKHAKQHNPDGTCRFGSHAEVREAIARAKDNGEAVSYGEAHDRWAGRTTRPKHGEF